MGIRRRGFPVVVLLWREALLFCPCCSSSCRCCSRLALCAPPFRSLAQFKLDLGDLDLTTDEINFDKIDEDLGRFQQDEIVKEALEKVWWWVAVW